jgi:hypothetical protein
MTRLVSIPLETTGFATDFTSDQKGLWDQKIWKRANVQRSTFNVHRPISQRVFRFL